jgi:uncharacterized protein YkwD
MTVLARALLLGLLTALAVSAPALAAGPADAVDRAIVKAINVQRAAHGLRAVKVDTGLARSADRWSASMARRGALVHGNVESRLRGVAPRSPYGETIALVVGSEAALAKQVVRMWIDSPQHRAILLSSRVRHVGAGRADGRGGWYVTADFSG